MKKHINYNSPIEVKESGAKAFRRGLDKADCQIDSRTSANALRWWHEGFDEEAKKTCKGAKCTAIRGVGHSDECLDEHRQTVCPEIFRGTTQSLRNIKI